MNNNEQLKKDVMDLLNQAMIKLEGIGKPESFEDNNYNTVFISEGSEKWDDETEDYKEVSCDMTTQYLACVKQMLKRTLTGKVSDVAHNENQYYNSNC